MEMCSCSRFIFISQGDMELNPGYLNCGYVYFVVENTEIISSQLQLIQPLRMKSVPIFLTTIHSCRILLWMRNSAFNYDNIGLIVEKKKNSRFSLSFAEHLNLVIVSN